MRRGAGRRLLWWGLLAAVVLGLLLGWYARIWFEDSPESRGREAAEGIRDRIRELTH